MENCVEGEIKRIIFTAAETGWSVLEIEITESKPAVTVVGTVNRAVEGERIFAVGEWTENPRFGRQFKCSKITVMPPSTLEGLRAFLASGAIEGIGRAYADRLVDRFGEHLPDVIENRPWEIKQIPGIGESRVAKIRESWRRHAHVRQLVGYLLEHGVTQGQARKIQDLFGDDAMTVVRSQPYRLTEVHGFAFRTADQIALKTGIAPDDPERIKSGIVYALDLAGQFGNSALPKKALRAQASRVLGVAERLIDEHLDDLARCGRISIEHLGGEVLAFLPQLASAERVIALGISAMLRDRPWWGQLDDAKQTSLVEAAQMKRGITLSPSQFQSAKLVFDSKVCLITGGPGCGKTTTTQVVIEVLQALGGRVTLAAPTGRAAKRLSDVTGAEAKTIHRLIGAGYGRDEEIDADTVLIDEASMVDADLMRRLINAMPENASLILVGDAEQLPSVGPGRVFADLIDSGLVPTGTLTEIHRQAEGSAIVSAAHAIRSGSVPRLEREGNCTGWEVATPQDGASVVEELVTSVLPWRYGLDPLRDIQVLTPMRKGTLGAIELNRRIQRLLNRRLPEGLKCGDQVFAPNDRVIVTKNDYDRGLFNGDIGFVHEVDLAAGSLTMDFDGRRIEYSRQEAFSLLLAYAVTVHKSQGAEYNGVVLVVGREHFTLLSRTLLYTGLTRAKQAAAVVFQGNALDLGVNKSDQHRWTGLVYRLRADAHTLAETAALAG